MEFTVIVCLIKLHLQKKIVKVGLCRVRIKLVVYSFCTLYHALFTSSRCSSLACRLQSLFRICYDFSVTSCNRGLALHCCIENEHPR